NGCKSDLIDVDNCGSCGHVCPGISAANDEVGCVNGGCTFVCKGENYDVNQNPNDGCEVADSPLNNHDSSHTIYLGSVDCYDGDSNWNPSGIIPSDSRVHQDPTVLGFDSSNGDAPDWFSIYGSGGTFCQDDVNVNLQIYGSANPGCYHLVVYTNKSTYQCQTNSSGACSVSQGS